MILSLTNVTKQFGGLTAINDVSFQLGEGQILGLIGPNGAGKTTLFNCINGVYEPTEGTIHFEDTDITGWKTYDVAHLGLARTHQIVRPLNDLSVRDNVMVGACFGGEGASLRSAAEVTDDTLEFVGLAPRENLLAGTLNVAQKKRLEMARALASRPRLLLLDEVLAGLNNFEVDQMLDTIRKIRDRGITIVMIEHIMHAVMNLSDRIVVLNFGQLIADGTPDEVANNKGVIDAYLGDPEMAAKLLEEDKEG